MATSLLLACGLNEQIIEPFIHISEESGVDGTFLISSILGQRLRVQNSAVILICLQQNYQHYQSAGMRLGYDLNMFNGKSLRVIAPLQDIAKNFIQSFWISKFADCSATLIDSIQNEITELLQNKKTSITIIIDNFGILMNLGVSKESILSFYSKFQETNEYHQSLITKLNNCETYEVLNNILKTFSNLNLNVIKLKSGNFKEVDGCLEICRESLCNNSEVKKFEKQILYKINDKNIRVFNPGEVGVKL